MEDKEIVELLLNNMNDNDLGFTSKTDPTFIDADFYYELDEYGKLTDASIKRIAKEVKQYIGDGAIDINEAIDLWVENSMINCTIAYKELLKTRFKDEQLIDQIKAFKNPIVTENKNITEGEDLEATKQNISNAVDDSNDLSINVIASSVNVLIADEQSAIDGYEAFLSQCEETVDVDVYDAVKAGVEEIIKDENEHIEKLVTIQSALLGNDTSSNTDNTDSLTENVKRVVRLNEENNKSAELIGDKLSSVDFDKDSREGQIVMRTSELFNVLSSAGYDVQVSFDNGESQSNIPLGKQGGNIIITITDTNKPLRAFVSGNFEILDETLDTMKDVLEQIKSI